MTPLNLPNCQLRFKNSENKQWVFDILRKKFVILTPEEWVRQHVIHYLKNQYGYPLTLMASEKKILINGLTKRDDLVVFSSDGTIKIAIECKAPEVQINQGVFDQLARYNLQLNAPFLMVTNGLKHYFCSINAEKQTYEFLKDVPYYSKSESI
jgi:hypothetical protein